MKKLLVLAMVLCLFALPALAESTQAIKLTVSGSASVSVEPDYAQVIIGAMTASETVDQSAEQNAAVTAAIKEALKTLGIAEEDVSTSSFNVNPSYDYGNYTGAPTVTGYQVEHMLKVTVRDLSQLGAVLDAAMKAGANQTYGVNFMSTKQADASDKALQNAIADGLRKAQIAAQAAGKELGSLIAIEEDYGYTPYYGATEKLAMDSAAGTSITAGMLEITASVKVTCELK